MTKSIVIPKCYSGNLNKKLKTKINKNSTPYLSRRTFNRMIHQFLTCDRIKTAETRHSKYTKQELAKELGISKQELMKPKKTHYYNKIANKINLPLIRLYCSAKWAK